MKVAITMPVYASDPLHLEFTENTINSIQTKHNYELIVVDNYCTPELQSRMDYLKPIKNPKGNCVAAAWNLGIKQGFRHGADYVIIANNDLIFHKDCIDNLVAFAGKYAEKFVLWSAVTHSNLRNLQETELEDTWDEHPGFSLFMVSPRTVEILQQVEKDTAEPYPGYLDENYEVAYFEDSDFHQRILRAGQKASKTAMAKYYHFHSRTISIDSSIRYANDKSYEKNRAYYQSKWGYDTHSKAPSNEQRIQWGHKNAFNK